MISPYYCGPTSSMLLHDASACNSSTPCYLLVPLDILLCQYWVISNPTAMDRTVICNEGVWVSGDHPLYPLAPLPISSSSLMATVIQNTTRIMTLALETGLVVYFLLFIYCWLNPVLLFRLITSGRAAPSLFNLGCVISAVQRCFSNTPLRV